MDRDEFKATWKNLSARIAFMAAAHAAETIEPEIEGRHWWCCGNPAVELIEGEGIDYPPMRSQAIVALAEFVVANPSAPAEAAFRFAAGREFHRHGPDAWTGLDLHWSAAYQTFHEVLVVMERLLGERARQMDAEDSAAAAAARAAEPPKALPGAVGLIDRPGALGDGLIPRRRGASPPVVPAEPEPKAERKAEKGAGDV